MVKDFSRWLQQSDRATRDFSQRLSACIDDVYNWIYFMTYLRRLCFTTVSGQCDFRFGLFFRFSFRFRFANYFFVLVSF